MTPTWNPERLARAVAAATGVHLVVEGPCPGGQVGAAYVRWPDGHLAVLSWGPGVPLAQARRGPFAVADALRADGYPAPATELAADTSGGLAVVQELLPGSGVPRRPELRHRLYARTAHCLACGPTRRRGAGTPDHGHRPRPPGPPGRD